MSITKIKDGDILEVSGVQYRVKQGELKTLKSALFLAITYNSFTNFVPLNPSDSASKEITEAISDPDLNEELEFPSSGESSQGKALNVYKITLSGDGDEPEDFEIEKVGSIPASTLQSLANGEQAAVAGGDDNVGKVKQANTWIRELGADNLKGRKFEYVSGDSDFSAGTTYYAVDTDATECPLALTAKEYSSFNRDRDDYTWISATAKLKLVA